MMRRVGNSRWRKEQDEVYKKLRLAFPEDEILMECPVYMGNSKVKIAVLDIANTTKRIAYRLQGEYHKKGKDDEQAHRLKGVGWKVIDLLIENGQVYDIVTP